MQRPAANACRVIDYVRTMEDALIVQHNAWNVIKLLAWSVPPATTPMEIAVWPQATATASYMKEEQPRQVHARFASLDTSCCLVAAINALAVIYAHCNFFVKHRALQMQLHSTTLVSNHS